MTGRRRRGLRAAPSAMGLRPMVLLPIVPVQSIAMATRFESSKIYLVQTPDVVRGGGRGNPIER